MAVGTDILIAEIVAAPQRSAKIKQKLEIDPIHAETVRLIYRT